ncbi:MAG: hypothetical protein ABIE47_09735 [Pseudomonadota bacterium]
MATATSEIALVENMLRQDLTPVEEAEGLQALMTEQQYTQEQLRIGGQISNLSPRRRYTSSGSFTADGILHPPMCTESKNPNRSTPYPPQNAKFKDLTPNI